MKSKMEHEKESEEAMKAYAMKFPQAGVMECKSCLSGSAWMHTCMGYLGAQEMENPRMMDALPMMIRR